MHHCLHSQERYQLETATAEGSRLFTCETEDPDISWRESIPSAPGVLIAKWLLCNSSSNPDWHCGSRTEGLKRVAKDAILHQATVLRVPDVCSCMTVHWCQPTYKPAFQIQALMMCCWCIHTMMWSCSAYVIAPNGICEVCDSQKMSIPVSDVCAVQHHWYTPASDSCNVVIERPGTSSYLPRVCCKISGILYRIHVHS